MTRPVRMKCLGLISGPQPHLTAAYWRELHDDIRQRLGASYTARLLVESIGGDEIPDPLRSNDKTAVAAMVIASAQRLQRCGAEIILLCSSSPHLVADAVVLQLVAPSRTVVGEHDVRLVVSQRENELIEHA